MDNSTPSCLVSIYHKKTYTGLLTNFFSFTSFKYKIDLIHTLVDRVFKINNTKSGLHKDLNKLSETLKRNSFPSHIINKTIKQILKKPKSTSISDNDCPSNANNSNTRYFKFLFIGNFSNITQVKIKQLSKRFCNDLDIKLVFSSYKIKNFFSCKDPVPTALKSFVVYQFSCARCNPGGRGEGVFKYNFGGYVPPGSPI